MRFFVFWWVFARFCVFLDVFLLLGHSWGAPGRSWDALGTLLGRSWGALGALLGALGRSWGALGALLERPWTLLGRSWGALGQNYEKNIVALRLWGCFGEGFWNGFGHLERPCKEPSFT